MITRDSTGGTLSAGFITRLQTRYETPQIIFKFQTDSTTQMNEELDDSETVLDVDDSSVFTDDDVILIDNELMLVTDDAVGANQIEVTRGYGTTIAHIHNDNAPIYIMTEYPVMNISDLSFDPWLGTPEAIVTVSNADQSWNVFLSDLTNHTHLTIIELQYEGLGEYMPIFTGEVDHVEYSDMNMTCSIYLVHKLTKFLNEEIGNPEDVLTYTAQNAADIVWGILVTEGGLDSTSSQANVDLDYTLWDAWKTKLATQDMDDVEARIPKGHTYRSACQAVLQLTSSWAFITNEGKIGFVHAANDAVAGDDTWTQAHILSSVDGGDVEGNRPFTDISELANLIATAYGYDVDTGNWDDGDITADGDSQGYYGLAGIGERDSMVWHGDAASAAGGAAWVLDIHKDPMVFSEIRTWLYGARVQIGDVIDLTDADYGWTNELLKVMQIISFDLTNFVITVLVRA